MRASSGDACTINPNNTTISPPLAGRTKEVGFIIGRGEIVYKETKLSMIFP